MRRVSFFATALMGLAVCSADLMAQQPYPPQGYPPQGNPQQQYPNPAYGQPPQGQGQPQGQPQDQVQDQPGQPVARLSIINGDASVRRGDTGDWVAAVPNAPLMAGDSVSVPPNGRAELQLDNSNFVRIGGDTEVRISDLEPGRNQIQIAKGTVTYRVLRDSNTQAEISTPSAAVHPMRLSSVRVEVSPDGMTKVTVRRGDADVTTPRGAEHVHEGSMMTLRGAPDDPEFQVSTATPHDAWDGWNDQRDQYLDRAQSNRYVSPDINGAEDLDPYGRWGYDPAYGNVWTPSVQPGWAPYQNGQWVWEDYYGWTWVDSDPWGWAPFHYGSWYQRTGFGWTWFPGPRIGHYWYHPALVGFFGFGGGVGFGAGFGFGSVGWIPLAPFEVFHPWYGRGGFGGRNVIVNNVYNVRNVNIASTFRNASVPGGARAVSAADFQRGAFSNQVAVNRTQLQQASLVRGAVPMSPTANNLRFTDRAAGSAGPRGEIGNQRFFSRMTPSAAASQRTPFAQQQAAVRSSLGERNMAASPQSGASGWQRFGEPNQAGSRSAGAAAAGGGSWDRFGSPQAQTQGQARQAAPSYAGRPAYSGGSNYAPQQQGRSLQVAPPIVRQREAAPSYSAPSYRSAPGGGGGGHAGGGHSGGHR